MTNRMYRMDKIDIMFFMDSMIRTDVRVVKRDFTLMDSPCRHRGRLCVVRGDVLMRRCPATVGTLVVSTVP